jgi:hypothetical protein
VTIIARNHGHDFPLALADVLAGAARTLQVGGSATHAHSITLSAAELAAIAAGEVLRKKTEFAAGHRHRVLVRCDPELLPPERISACEVVVAGQDGHELVIPESHVRGGQDREYDIQGVSGHTHQLRVTASDFARLIAGEALDLLSARSLGHFHHVYIRYPA